MLVDDAAGERHFARVKVPPVFPRFVDLGDGRLLPLERLIAAHLDLLFPGTSPAGCWAFRVTRDAELLVDEGEADDLLAAIESGLHRRLRVNDAVRLEIEAAAAPEVIQLLTEGLDLAESDVYLQHGPLALGALWQLYAIDRPDLKDAPWQPATQARLGREAKVDLFAVLRAGDVMVHHPYDSFRTSVEAFLEQAARDPDVLAIKHTLYRTAVRDNRVLRALIQAAQDGKEVVTLVEIKARFDEEANIEWARSLESAGGNVVYGLVGLKTHGKVVLVVRSEHDGIRRYCHIGTGNYNPETARVYEDVGLFTASPEIGADVGELFNHLTGFGVSSAYRKLLVAPDGLRTGLLEQIRTEAAADGRRDHDQGERPPGSGHGRRALRRVARRREDRPADAEHLLPAARRARPLRERARAQRGGPLPRALAHLPLRQRGARAPLLPRLGRPDDAQPRPARRGARARRGPGAARAARPDPRR